MSKKDLWALRASVWSKNKRGPGSPSPPPPPPLDTPLTMCPAYQKKRGTLFEYLNKEYRISVNRMAPDDVFLLLINPPSKNKPVQKLIAKYVLYCYEKRRSLVL